MQDFDPSVPKTEQGLIRKYNVERLDGNPVGEGIFLEFDDPNSWAALRLWADTVAAKGYTQLYTDVRTKVSLAIERNEIKRLQEKLNG